jgi:cytochrome c-type biogenesis protein CcmH/NrfG
MLFDLRGRGRRRTVQVIYLGLAILMGGGLVLFGIGGATSGGLFDAINGDGNKSSGTEALERTATTAQAATQASPQDAAAWARLVKARFQLAGTNDGVDPNTGAFTAAGKRRLRPVEQAWDRYVALDPDPPDDTVAGYMVQAFSAGGLNEPAKAVRAMEMVIQVRGDNTNLYSQLAVLAYQAGQNRKGDLARDKAVALAAPADRKLLKENLNNAKAQAVADQATKAGTTPLPASTSTTSTGTTSTTG